MTSEVQRALQARAVELVEQVLDTRWVVITSTNTPVPIAFIVIMVFWLAVTFASFGLFAPGNGRVVTALLVSALSVSCAIFLVPELRSPCDDIVKVSCDPMRHALSLLNR